MPEPRTQSLKILVVDDQPHVLEAMRLLLKSAGHSPSVAGSPRALFELAEKDTFDLILLDMNYSRDTTSGTEGLHLLERLRHLPDAPPVIAMTAWGNIELAVEAMRAGASDFIEKPWDNERLLRLIEKITTGTRQRSLEMEVARRVQARLQPAQRGVSGGLDYRIYTQSAFEVGGDYADVLSHGAVVLADVSGKGVAGAMLAANLQAHFRSAGPGEPPVDLIRRVNRAFFQCTPPEHYATLFYGVVDAGLLHYVNCGHVPPVLLRANGDVEMLDATGGLVGLFEIWQGEARQAPFATGDTLLVFSDGVAEAGEGTEREIAPDAILQLCRNMQGRPLDDVVDQLMQLVRTASGAAVADDATILGIRIAG